MTVRFAVMGNPIAHSLSPVIHQLFAQQTGKALLFERIEADLQDFEREVRGFFEQEGQGLSITLPFKQRAYAMAEHLSERCLEAKAANTLCIKEGRLYADNTDGVGLLRDLHRHVDLAGLHVLLLGAGGAARGVLGPLLKAAPLQLTVANRTLDRSRLLQADFPAINLCSWSELGQCGSVRAVDVVINATSASLAEQHLLLPESLLYTKPFCYDLAYDRTQATVFVAWAQEFGCKAVDGLGMLVEQAAEAFLLWHGVLPQTGPVLKVLREKGFNGIC